MDPVFMLKCLFAQRVMGLADEAFEAAMRSNLFLQRFLCIEDPRDIPSNKTIWKYREVFTRQKIFETIFKAHLRDLQTSNPELGTKAQVIDSTFVEAPKQRNSREENKIIKEGTGDQLWLGRPHKRSHKDIDASWTKKRQEVHYGYKGHLNVCAETKLILRIITTTAKVHDSTMVGPLISRPSKRTRLYADAGYIGKGIEEFLKTKKRMIPFINQRGTRGHQLTEGQKLQNPKISVH